MCDSFSARLNLTRYIRVQEMAADVAQLQAGSQSSEHRRRSRAGGSFAIARSASLGPSDFSRSLGGLRGSTAPAAGTPQAARSPLDRGTLARAEASLGVAHRSDLGVALDALCALGQSGLATYGSLWEALTELGARAAVMLDDGDSPNGERLPHGGAGEISYTGSYTHIQTRDRDHSRYRSCEWVRSHICPYPDEAALSIR